MKTRALVIGLCVLALGLMSLYLFSGLTPRNAEYFLSRRIPRVTAMLLAGAGTGIAALAMQAFARNRILTPALLGIDSLYVMLQSAVILAGGSWMVQHPGLNALTAVFLSGLFSLALWRILGSGEERGVTTLVLAGLVAGTLFRSASGFLQMIADPNEFSILQGFLYASFTRIDSRVVWALLPVFLGLFIFLLRGWRVLDVLWLGPNTARSLGVETGRVNRDLFLGACSLTAVSTALAGPLTFFGLILANIAREVVGKHDHRLQAAVVLPLGIIATVGGQLLLERTSWFRMPLNVVIGITGGAYLIFLLVKKETP